MVLLHKRTLDYVVQHWNMIKNDSKLYKKQKQNLSSMSKITHGLCVKRVVLIRKLTCRNPVGSHAKTKRWQQEWLVAEVPLLSKTGCLAQCSRGSCTNDFWKHGCKPGQQKAFANLPQTFRERAKKIVIKIQNICCFWTGAFFGQNLFPNKGPALRKY